MWFKKKIQEKKLKKFYLKEKHLMTFYSLVDIYKNKKGSNCTEKLVLWNFLRYEALPSDIWDELDETKNAKYYDPAIFSVYLTFDWILED